MFNLGFLNPFQSKDGFVALDIGSSSIKLAETAFERNGFRLCSLGILPLPPDAIQQNMVVEPAPLVEAVRQLIKEHGVSATKVICAVPGRAVIMKKIQMPRQTDEELETNIEFEANNVIPENLANVNLDYQVLKLLDGGNKMEVLLVAVKKDIVNSYAEVPIFYSLTVSLGFVLFVAILINSTFRIASGRGVVWKGRKIYDRASAIYPSRPGQRARRPATDD